MVDDSGEVPAEIRAAYSQACLILPDIEATIRKSARFRPPLSWRFRAKSLEAIIEKIARKKRRDAKYDLSKMHDLIGGRFVTLYKSDLVMVVSNLLSLTTPSEAEDDGTHNQLKGARIIEIAQHIAMPEGIFTDNPPVDAITDELLYMLDEHGIDGEKLKRYGRTNYSSVHLVLGVRHQHASGGTFPVELQIRTIFEDAWGEVDHQLLYEETRKRDSSEKDKADDSNRWMTQDLSLLKRMLDLAGEYAEAIRARGQPRTAGVDPRFESLGDPQYVGRVCKKTGFPDDLTERLVALVQRKEDLDKIPGPKKAYLSLASDIAALVETIKKRCGAEFPDVFYLARMEEPIARLRTEDERQISRAYRLYKGITKSFPHHPTGWFRRGQAAMKYGSLKDNETRIGLAVEAAGYYREAESALSAASKLVPGKRLLLISDSQLQKVKQRLPRLHGYALWTASDLRRRDSGASTPADFEAMMQAFRMARDGLPHAEAKGVPGLRQNMLYYALDALDLAAKYAMSAADLPTPEQIEEITRDVEKEEREREEQQPDIAKWRVLHTLLLAYQYLGWADKEVEQASVLLDVINDEDWSSASKEVSYLMKRAQHDAAEALKRRSREGPAGQ